MLYHFRPRCFSPIRGVVLLKAGFPEFGITLWDKTELATGKPYPNRWYSVGCRKNTRRKAYNGLLIEAAPMAEFSAFYIWHLTGVSMGVHVVRYILSDQTFDTVSDDTFLWNAQRQIDIPMEMNTPIFRYVPGEQEALYVENAFAMPTIERASYEASGDTRLPPVDGAFIADELTA